MPPLDPSDLALLDTVQRQTLRYFWDFAHPACGLARERSNAPFDYGLEAVATGGTGFGVLAIIDGADIVETSFLMAGLLCARQYFDRADPTEAELRQRIGWIWNDVEWRWHTKDGSE